MIVRKTKVVAAFGALVFVAGLAASPVHAAKKKCPKLCKDAISACLAAVPAPSTCTGTAKEKKTCKRDIAKRKKDCRKGILKACKDRAATVAADVCSPSGAFLSLVD